MNENDNILISIIVPVYNSEKYLRNCIQSICEQTYSNIEILLVDDGSSDKSGTICDKYSLIDRRIKVIHKENGGQLDATIAGVREAQGEYIGFVDSDDWIDSNMYASMIGQIGDADLVTSGIFKYGAEGKVIDEWTDLFTPGVYYTNEKKFLDNFIISKKYNGGTVVGGISNNLVSKLFRTEVVRKISEEANVKVADEEDFLFCLLYILRCKKIIITHNIFYHYRFNPDSVVNTINPNFLSERTIYYRTVMNAIDSFAHGQGLREQFQRRFLFSIYSIVGKKMGIDQNVQYPRFQFPKENSIRGKKVIVFGCGEVGISYIKKWIFNSICSVILWVDNKPKNIEIGNLFPVKPDEIFNVEFDYIVCAVLFRSQSDAIKEQLLEMGVPLKKIIWQKPDNIWREYFLKEIL